MSLNTSPPPMGAAMRAEMADQPRALRQTLSAYAPGQRLSADILESVRDWLGPATEILIAASGSSRHAGLYTASRLHTLAGVQARVVYASEAGEMDALQGAAMFFSQSGETADTLAALRRFRAQGARALAVTNAPGSTMAREGEAALFTRAGREQAIPATKSFTTQLLVGELVALAVAQVRGLDEGRIQPALEALWRTPDEVETQLAQSIDAVERFAALCLNAAPIVFLGRGLGTVTAAEGALKLKESAYVHAESIPAGEFRHGPIAMVDERACAVLIATYDPYDAASRGRRQSLLDLARDLNGYRVRMLALVNAEDRAFADAGCLCVPVASSEEQVAVFTGLIPLQQLAYHAAAAAGIDVDRPRNLSKAVLV